MDGLEQVLTIKGEPMARKGGEVSVQNISLNKIKLARNSRLSVSKDELAGLMQSIKEVGLLQPIGVQKSGSGYEIVYGNRRFMAVSKLGLAKIPAIVHTHQKQSEGDLKNLTENIQRRNISLCEGGRYIELLKKDGLTSSEIAVRLGVSAGYVDSCLKAYNEVPVEFQPDLEISKSGTGKAAPGKIGIKTAKAILVAKKNYGLSAIETKKMFRAAKSDDRFNPASAMKYAAAIKRGKEDFIKEVKPIRTLSITLKMDEDHYYELENKYVTDGPFSSMSALVVAILRGQKAVKIDVI